MNKAGHLHIRISLEIKELLEQKAAQLGMSISEYVRFLILEDAKREVK